MACIFCSILARSAPGFVLWEDEAVAVLLSLEGHPLVLPKRHIPNLDALDDPTSAALMCAAAMAARALRTETGCDGINLILSDGTAAGQDVFHLHMHVKPRWDGDAVVLSWDTETAPEAERTRLASALSNRLSRVAAT